MEKELKELEDIEVNIDLDLLKNIRLENTRPCWHTLFLVLKVHVHPRQIG